MYQEFVKEVLEFYGIAGGLGQATSAAAAAAIVDLEAKISSTVRGFFPFDLVASIILMRCQGATQSALGCAEAAVVS
jgi:hypothetical protein